MTSMENLLFRVFIQKEKSIKLADRHLILLLLPTVNLPTQLPVMIITM